MALPDLVDSSRAQQSPTLATLYAGNPTYFASLITAASAKVRQYCHRDFSLSNYSAFYSGGIYIREPINLRQYPVSAISRIAANPTAVITVSNSGSTVQRATVETLTSDSATCSGVRLTWVASGVSTSTTILTASYPTLAGIVSQINAVGNSFSASIFQSAPNINVSLYPSADLRPSQGASSVIGAGACLWAWIEDIGSMSGASGWDDDGDCWGSSYGWRLDSAAGQLYGRFPVGQMNIRVDYTAGFPVVPQDVQEAAVQITQDLYSAGQLNSSVSSASLGQYAYSIKSTSELTAVSGKAAGLLNPYIVHSNVIYRG